MMHEFPGMILEDLDRNPIAGDTRIEALSRNAVSRQWSLEAAIDWRQPVIRPWWLPTRTYVAMVSQLYYAEIAAMQMCERLLAELSEPEAKGFLRTQIVDETRHIEAYRAYLEKLGDIGPINEAVATALNGGLEWTGSYHGAVVAFNVVLEGEAVRLQQELGDLFPCPLLKQINEKISRDEARHFAFGKIYIRDRLRSLTVDERLAIYRWVRRLWHACTNVNSGRRWGPGSAIIRSSKRRLEERWQGQVNALIDIGLVSASEASLA